MQEMGFLNKANESCSMWNSHNGGNGVKFVTGFVKNFKRGLYNFMEGVCIKHWLRYRPGIIF